MVEKNNHFFNRSGNKEEQEEKVVEGIFIEPDEIVDANFEESESQHTFRDFSKVNLKNSLAIRLLSFLIFVLVLLFSAASLAFFAFSLLRGIFLCLGQNKDWQEPIGRAWSYFRRTLVAALASLVGIFHPHFGLLIFLVYSSIVEPVPSLIADFFEKQR